MRAARVNDSSALHVRITFPEPRDSARVADALSRDSTLRRLGAVYSWSRVGPRAPSDSAEAKVVRAIAPEAIIPAGPTLVSVVAAREPHDLLGLVAKALAPLPKQRQTRAPARRSRPGDVTEERIAAADETQVTVVAGLPGVGRGHRDRRALELLSYIVGVPWYGGRLGWALTKSGLTYSSGAAATFGAESGYLLFSTTCDTRNTDATIQAISEVLVDVGARGVEEWELREAQAFTLGRMLLYGAREDSRADDVVAVLADSELAGLDLLDLPAFSRAYLSVTLEDLNRVARTYYRAELLKVVAVGAIPSRRERRIFPDGTFRSLFTP